RGEEQVARREEQVRRGRLPPPPVREPARAERGGRGHTGRDVLGHGLLLGQPLSSGSICFAASSRAAWADPPLIAVATALPRMVSIFDQFVLGVGGWAVFRCWAKIPKEALILVSCADAAERG